jgi:hypothetical protein
MYLAATGRSRRSGAYTERNRTRSLDEEPSGRHGTFSNWAYTRRTKRDCTWTSWVNGSPTSVRPFLKKASALRYLDNMRWTFKCSVPRESNTSICVLYASVTARMLAGLQIIARYQWELIVIVKIPLEEILGTSPFMNWYDKVLVLEYIGFFRPMWDIRMAMLALHVDQLYIVGLDSWDNQHWLI